MGICSFTAMGNSSQRPEVAPDSTPVLYGSKLSIHLDNQRPDPYLAEALQLLSTHRGCCGACWLSSGPRLLPCCCRSNRELSCKKIAVVTANFACNQLHKWKTPFLFPCFYFQWGFSGFNERRAPVCRNASNLALPGGVPEVPSLITLCAPGRKLPLPAGGSCWIGEEED